MAIWEMVIWGFLTLLGIFLFFFVGQIVVDLAKGEIEDWREKRRKNK